MAYRVGALLLACTAALAGTTAPAQSVAVSQAGAEANVAGLLSADRAFAAASANAEGFAGFEAMFADDVVMYAVPVPGFARGRAQAVEVLGRAIGPGGTTSWTPIRGGISADGRHGFTFGYMTTRRAGQPDLPAKYLAYWVRQGSGWRVALYKRAPRAEGPVSLDVMPPSLPAASVPATVDARALERYRQSLEARERFFSDEAQRIGQANAFRLFGSPDAVNLGGAPEFTVGPNAIADAQGPGASVHWAADGGVIVAPSGDLGVTWGFLHRNEPPPPGRLAQIPFFTVWRRAGPAEPWLYVAE